MGTHFRGPPAQAAALDTYIKLVRAAESLTNRSHALLPARLTITQFGVLEALYHLGPLCPGELAGKMLKSAGNLTLVIANLAKAGLVHRERNPEDRRSLTVHLTPGGRRHIAALFPKIAGAITAEFGVLTAAEQAALARLCRKLGWGRAQPPAPGMPGAPPPRSHRLRHTKKSNSETHHE